MASANDGSEAAAQATKALRLGLSVAALESLRRAGQAGCGLDFDPLARDYLGRRGIAELQGKISPA